MQYIGNYSRVKNRLLPKDKEQNTLYIRNRKQELQKKPKQFLLEKVDGKMVYVSSLFPTTQANSYKFDNRQQVFNIQVSEDGATITSY
jgi:hypothetical protein